MEMSEDQLLEARKQFTDFAAECAEYGVAISALAAVNKVGSLVLVKSQLHRIRMIQEPEIEEWLRAIEEVLNIFDLLNACFRRQESLSRAAFLIDRAKSDIEFVVELAISGGLHPFDRTTVKVNSST